MVSAFNKKKKNENDICLLDRSNELVQFTNLSILFKSHLCMCMCVMKQCFKAKAK